MEIIIHRINTLSKLRKIPKHFGVEIDVRDYKKKLVLSHDPFKNGENLEFFLRKYNHGTLIVNIKSEFIEFKIIKLLKKYKIKKYFFLDSSYPVIINLMKKRAGNFAIRVSDYESFENIYNIYPQCKWIWLEIFNSIKLKKKDIKFIKDKNLKICLVSPELHMKKKDINKVKRFIDTNDIKISCVCTKRSTIKNWIK